MPARRDFLQAMREVTRAHGIVLIFDEVISFRVGYHGAQGAFGSRPTSTLGKIIGGESRSAPSGARRGHRRLQPHPGHPPAPHGWDVQRGSGHDGGGPRGDQLLDPEAFGRFDKLAPSSAQASTHTSARRHPGRVTGMGSLFRLHPIDRDLVDYRSTRTTAEEGERLLRLIRRLHGARRAHVRRPGWGVSRRRWVTPSSRGSSRPSPPSSSLERGAR